MKRSAACSLIVSCVNKLSELLADTAPRTTKKAKMADKENENSLAKQTLKRETPVKEKRETPLKQETRKRRESGKGKRTSPTQPLRVILATGLNPADKELIQATHQAKAGLPGPWRLSHDYTRNCTQVIAGVESDGKLHRTGKLLQALLEGKPIVRMEWFLQCVEHGEWLPEDAYLLPESKRSLVAHAEGRMLFDGLSFWLNTSLASRVRTDLTQLIKLGGGSVCTRKAAADFFIAETGQHTPSWLSECICNYDISK